MGKGTCRVGKADQERQQGPGRVQQMQWSGSVFREGKIWAKSSRRQGGLASGYVGEASFRKRKQLGLMCLVYSKNNEEASVVGCGSFQAFRISQVLQGQKS